MDDNKGNTMSSPACSTTPTSNTKFSFSQSLSAMSPKSNLHNASPQSTTSKMKKDTSVYRPQIKSPSHFHSLTSDINAESNDPTQSTAADAISSDSSVNNSVKVIARASVSSFQADI